MSRMVQCKKLGKEAEGLESQAYPGETGKKIFENISKEAWAMWISHQTILINENRLALVNPEHRKFLAQEMEKYLFGDGSELPAKFKAPDIE